MHVVVVAHVVGAWYTDVEPKARIGDSAGVLHAFLCTRAKATCHQEGPMRAPDGLDEPPRRGRQWGLGDVRSKEDAAEVPDGPGKPPAGRLGGCKLLIFIGFYSVFTFCMHVVLVAHVVGA